ncbi:MAG: hypothetical protein ABWX70_05275 [Hyphomicrobium sp.]
MSMPVAVWAPGPEAPETLATLADGVPAFPIKGVSTVVTGGACEAVAAGATDFVRLAAFPLVFAVLGALVDGFASASCVACSTVTSGIGIELADTASCAGALSGHAKAPISAMAMRAGPGAAQARPFESCIYKILTDLMRTKLRAADGKPS